MSKTGAARAACVALMLGCASAGCGDETKNEGDDTDAGDGSEDHVDAGHEGQDAEVHADRDGGAVQDASDEGDAAQAMANDDCEEGKTGAPDWEVLDLDLPDFGVIADQTSSAPATKGFTGVAYGNGMFVAIGNSYGEDVARWATSPDGLTWTAHSEKLPDGQRTATQSRIHFRNGKFIYFAERQGAGAHVYWSSNAATWSDQKISDERVVLDEFDASEELYEYAGHDGKMQSSADLTTWNVESVSSGGGLFSFSDIAFGGGRWVAATNGAGTVYGSADGKDWMLIAGLSQPGGFSIEYGEGLWVASAPGQVVYTSDDGQAFVKQTASGTLGAPPRYAGKRFIGYYGGPPTHMTTSSDGYTLSAFGDVASIDPPETGGSVSDQIRDIAYGKCTYVLAGVRIVAGKPDLAKPYIQDQRPFIVVGSLK